MTRICAQFMAAVLVAAGMEAASAADKTGASRDYSSVVAPEFRRVPAQAGAEVVVIDASGRGATGPFHVSEVMDPNVFGQMNKPDEKFVKNAASATLALDEKELKIVVDCPIPAGVKPNPGSCVWNGDLVLIRVKSPSGKVGEYCIHFSRGAEGTAGGKLSLEKYEGGVRAVAIVPTAQLFPGGYQPGDAFGLKIDREGATCGGLSTFAKNGGEFTDGSHVYGTVVCGDLKAYFTRRLRTAVADFLGNVDDPDAKAAVRRVSDPVMAAINRQGGDVAGFASIEQMLSSLDNALLAIHLGGRPNMLYEPADAWENAPEPTLKTKPLEAIRIRTARNTREVKALALMNFRDVPYVGNIKFFDRYDEFYHTAESKPLETFPLARRITVRRAVAVCTANGKNLFDPLVDLPLGSLVEVPAGRAAPLFAELDTHGVPAGKYRLELVLRSALFGFMNERIPVEVEVTDDDLEDEVFDKWCFTYFMKSFGAAGQNDQFPVTNCIRRLVQRDYNLVFISRFDDMYPVQDEKGEWHSPTYRTMDRYIDAWVAGGLTGRRLKVCIYLGVDRATRRSWRGIRDHRGEIIQMGTPDYTRGFSFMIRDIKRHLKERYGIGRENIVWMPADEVWGPKDDPEFKSKVSRVCEAARLIKADDPANLIYWNPLPRYVSEKEFVENAAEFVKLFDIIDLYYPDTTAQHIRDVQAAGYRQVWASHISGRGTNPSRYRGLVWYNLQQGFTGLVDYWHIDEFGAFDAMQARPYASVYADWDMDDIVLSRRQLAADMGHEDAKLVHYLRRKYAGDPGKLEKIAAIVKRASAMSDRLPPLEAARAELMKLL